MAFVEWKDEFSVSIPEMDAEHKTLFGLINELHDAIREGRPREGLQQVLGGLAQYANRHFMHEEILMRQHRYDGLAAQESAHRAFEAKVREYESRLRDGEIVLTFEVGSFMRTWITEHIKLSDKLYARALTGITS